jgi:predicted nuclease of predicted toxin-antitoxin system
MKWLLDVNLSPAWVEVLSTEGREVRHWMSLGATTATDAEIMNWARAEGYVVLTHDLDFSAILAATQAKGPSVVQLRAQDIVPETLGPTLTGILRRFAESLERGAILTIDLPRSRIRMLPIRLS